MRRLTKSKPFISGMSLFLVIIFLIPSPTRAQEGTTASQAGINEWLVRLETDFGITAAFPGEWQAASASEVQQLYEGLANIYSACAIVAEGLWRLDGAPSEITSIEHFRLHFDRAHIQIDRTTRLGADFAGNTAPQYVDGKIAGYMIQLSPLGLSQPFTFAHEIGHVVDSMLGDQPHKQHVLDLGGTVGTTGWIPGKGYWGNELLFPRAVGGANEDFADTFGEMMLGRLSPLNSTMPRWRFMVRHTDEWLSQIRELPE